MDNLNRTNSNRQPSRKGHGMQSVEQLTLVIIAGFLICGTSSEESRPHVAKLAHQATYPQSITALYTGWHICTGPTTTRRHHDQARRQHELMKTRGHINYDHDHEAHDWMHTDYVQGTVDQDPNARTRRILRHTPMAHARWSDSHEPRERAIRERTDMGSIRQCEWNTITMSLNGKPELKRFLEETKTCTIKTKNDGSD